MHPLQQEHYKYIMDQVINCRIYSDKEIETINNCHLHLWVITISNLANLQKTHLLSAAHTGNYVLLDSWSSKKHIQIQYPGKNSWWLWFQVLHTYADKSGKLYQSLEQWNDNGQNLKHLWNNYYNFDTNIVYRHKDIIWQQYIKIGALH